MRSSASFEALELRRLFVTLAPDVTFGYDGSIAPPDESGGLSYSYNFIGLTGRGVIVTRGVYDGRNDSRVDTLQRYRADGTPDPAFATPTLPSDTDVLGTGADVISKTSVTDAEGRTLIARATDDNFVYVSRYRVDGTPDRAFGHKGMTRRKLPVTIGERYHGGGVELAVMADGTVFVAAGAQYYSEARPPAAGIDAAYAFKLTPAGQFDDAYGNGGVATVANVQRQFAITNFFGVDAHGRLIVSTTSVGKRFTVTRYAADGTLDPSYAKGGTYTLRLADFPRFEKFAATLDSQGRVLIARSRTTASITRLNERGRVDPTFGTNGTVAGLSATAEQYIDGVLPATDGSVTLLIKDRAGEFANATVFLIGLHADGSRDTRLGSGGVARVVNAFAGAELLARLSDGNYLIEPIANRQLTKFAPIRPFALSPATGKLTFFQNPTDASNTNIQIAARNGGTRVTYNGQSTDYGAGAVRLIEATLNDGTNVFDSSLDVPTTVSGGTGADYITTGDADDRISTEFRFRSDAPDGYSQINAGGGADYIFLGTAGRHGYTVDAGPGGGQVTGGDNGRGNITVTGRSGHWDIGLSSAKAVNVRLAGHNADVIVKGLTTTVDLTGVTESNVQGSINNDRITTGPGRDRIYSFGGNDTIATGAGDDLIYGDLNLDPGVDGGAIDEARAPRFVGRDDRIDAGAGDDLVYDLYGNNTVTGGAGDDTLTTGDGQDRIFGGVGRDLIRGGARNDILYGEAGTDHLFGGRGDDLIYSGIAGEPPIRDIIDGGIGDDRWVGDEIDELTSIENRRLVE
ncbi:MAG: hypothetical protein H7144_01250 [Burkholderiales bacterium]|nr:hypothetical protein [Phycisphaerae bacterium]